MDIGSFGEVLMKKTNYYMLTLVLAAVLSGCTSEGKSSDDIAKKAEENTKKVEQMESEETFVFTEDDNTATLTKYNGNDSDVMIPEEYNGKKVTAIEEGTFSDYGQIKSITIPCSVNKIEDSNMETMTVMDGVVLKVYDHSMGELFALQQGAAYEIIGENTTQASYVTICDKEGIGQETVYLGSTSLSESLKGVSFQEKDGKSTLILDNCDIGSILVDEFAELTIELADGSVNNVTGNNGKDGMDSWGNVTITGNGQLQVTGSDYSSVREGENSSVGCGIWVWGNLTVENQAKVIAKTGQSSSIAGYGIIVERGNIVVNGSTVEAIAGTDADINGAAIILYNVGTEEGSKLQLTNASIVEGGKEVPLANEERYDDDYTISKNDKVMYVEEEGYVGASEYVRIEPQ